MNDQELRAARQVLLTGVLLGVDFVPIHRGFGPGAGLGSGPGPGVDESDAEAPIVEAPRLAPPAVVVRREPAVTASTELSAQGAVEPKPMPARTLNPKQQETQARLDALRARYEREAPHERFVTDHHRIVFGDGDPCARLMIIGEAPGAEEDKVGIPFVGRAGQLLEKMLGGMGIKRGDVYITNVLKTRPPNNATPTADEAAACAPYLFEQIRTIQPEAILALGLPATRVLLNTTEAMSRLRGRWWVYTDPTTIGYEVPVMPTYHPAFLLRSYTRENREKVWSDLQMVMEKLGIKPAKAAGSA